MSFSFKIFSWIIFFFGFSPPRFLFLEYEVSIYLVSSTVHPLKKKPFSFNYSFLCLLFYVLEDILNFILKPFYSFSFLLCHHCFQEFFSLSFIVSCSCFMRTMSFLSFLWLIMLDEVFFSFLFSFFQDSFCCHK